MADDRSWVQIRVPPEFKAGPDGLAAMARWRVKRQSGDTWAVTLDERYTKSKPRLVELVHLIGGDSALDGGWDRLPSLRSQDAGLDRDRVKVEVERHLEADKPAAVWNAWRLTVTTCPDEALQENLRGFHERVLQLAPDASLWVVSVDHLVSSRLAAIRALFAAEHAPELIARAPEDFSGFLSARGLGDSSGLAISSLTASFCAWLAPWLLGISADRLTSCIVTLSGQLWDGIEVPCSSDMLQLFASHLLVRARSLGKPRPSFEPTDVVRAFSWWVEQCNRLLFVLLDPAHFRTEDGIYDPAAHLATVLTVDRLLASVLTSLVNDPRGKYVRRVVLFDVLEIFEGLGQGGYDYLCDFNAQQREVGRLRAELPREVGNLLLPRCERAVAALEEVGSGFLQERRSERVVRTVNKHGGSEEITTHGAVAAYLRGVRNTTHSFRRVITNPRALSLLAGHDGEIPDEVSDLASLHLLRLLDDPTRALPPSTRRSGSKD